MKSNNKILLRKNITYGQALTKVMAICSGQEKCQWDIEQKLKKWNLPLADINKVIKQLKKEKFIDELRYAKAFANDKFKINKWGKQKIKYALLQKQISENTIKKALEDINNKEYTQILENEINKKLSSLKGNDTAKKKEKLIRYAISKGFELEMIFPIVNSILP